MTVAIQHFDRAVVISADFKDYLINFEPMHINVPRPIPKPLPSITRGLGVLKKVGIKENPVYEEVVEKMKEVPGLDIEDIFNKPTGRITEWAE